MASPSLHLKTPNSIYVGIAESRKLLSSSLELSPMGQLQYQILCKELKGTISYTFQTA
jgi:hypothetical protein